MRELSQHVLDALENTLEAGATRVELIVEEDSTADWLTIIVQDNGRGMSEEQLKRIFDPFFTTRKTRHVGLGVPLFKAAAERCNGELSVVSWPGKGTVLQATFQHSHIDRAPLGNIQRTLLVFLLSLDRNREAPSTFCDLHYVHRVDGREFEFDTADIRSELGQVPLAHPAVRNWLQEFIAEGETELGRKSL